MEQNEVLLKEYIKDLDRKFDQETFKRGLEGWVSFFADDAVMVPSQGDVIKGKEAIRGAMRTLFDYKEFSLRWEPLSANLSDDLSMAYTYGEYIRTYLDNNNNLNKSTGKYTTIWKKQPDGEWRIVLDIGN